jgi:hypothetical protein
MTSAFSTLSFALEQPGRFLFFIPEKNKAKKFWTTRLSPFFYSAAYKPH